MSGTKFGGCDGATTLSIMTFGITALNIAKNETLSITTFSIMTLETVVLSIVYA